MWGGRQVCRKLTLLKVKPQKQQSSDSCMTIRRYFAHHFFPHDLVVKRVRACVSGTPHGQTHKSHDKLWYLLADGCKSTAPLEDSGWLTVATQDREEQGCCLSLSLRINKENLCNRLSSPRLLKRHRCHSRAKGGSYHGVKSAVSVCLYTVGVSTAPLGRRPISSITLPCYLEAKILREAIT